MCNIRRRKYIKKSVRILTVLALAAIIATSVFALTACGEKTLKEATGLEYKEVSVVFNDGSNYRNGYEVVGLGTETLTSFAVPATYEGKPVISISEKAFENTNIVEIALPESVYVI